MEIASKKAGLPAALLRNWRDALDEVWPRSQVTEMNAMRQAGWRVDRPDEYCRRCGATTGAGGSTAKGCGSCLGKKMPWNRVVRLGVYDDPISWWVWQFKYHHQWAWAKMLGPMIAGAIRESDLFVDGARAKPQAGTFVCHVPMHAVRRWRRGYDQARLLAKEVSAAMDWPMLPALRRVRNTKPQVSVPAAQRAANVKDSFAMDAVDLRGCCVWLIDDVKTTGATMLACAKLLRRSGASEVNLAVLAVARGRHEPPLRHRRGLAEDESGACGTFVRQ
jgi:ComF family protein